MICPRCKEDMPLLSKICPVCGYVVEGGEGNVSAEMFIKKLEENLLEIKRLPEPTIKSGFMNLAYIFYPVITFFAFLMAVLTQAGLFWIFTMLFAVLSVVQIVKKMKGKRAVDIAQKQFNEIKLVAVHNEREARRNYGKSREVSLLVEDISAQITKIEAARKKQYKTNMLIWIAALVILFGLLSMSVVSVGSAINEAEKAKAEECENIF